MYCIIYVRYYLKSSFFITLQCIQRTYCHKTVLVFNFVVNYNPILKNYGITWPTKYMYIILTLDRH